ncbi:hypothetical protein KSD_76790 [Ktedonobacter sp. SOSP1-85]|nr:hypothetical protein KSD_76790 [Ktedonobacter sp. SOSP1-85]
MCDPYRGGEYVYMNSREKITYPDTEYGVKSMLAGYDWNGKFKWK